MVVEFAEGELARDGSSMTYRYRGVTEGGTLKRTADCIVPATDQAVERLNRLFDVPREAKVRRTRPGGGTVEIQGCVESEGGCTLDGIVVTAPPREAEKQVDCGATDPYCSGSGTGGDGGWSEGGGGGGDTGGYDPENQPPPGITDAEWNSLNPTEKAMCRSNPGECWHVFRSSNHAADWAAAETPDGAHNGLQDAMRHAMWNAEMTKRMNAARAQAWADAHELSSTNEAETRMDLWNNQWGRWAGNNIENTAVGVRYLRDTGKLCHPVGAC
jgi:hypothetical protein